MRAWTRLRGKYIFSHDLGIQNVISSIDPKTGEKTINPAVVIGDQKPHMICPHPGGGRNWIAGSYDATRKIVFVALNESCMDLIPAAPGQRGNLTSGVNWFIRLRPDSDGKVGRVEAFNLETKKVLWMDRQRAPQTTCLLDTAGGVAFAGSFDRNLQAYDDATGKTLWQMRLNDVAGFVPDHLHRGWEAVRGCRCRQRRPDYRDVSGARAGDSESTRSWRRDLGIRIAGEERAVR